MHTAADARDLPTTDQFDLDAYLARIGHDGGRRPDLATLRALVAAHTRTIAFENLDPFLRRPVRLDPASLQAKLVRGGRGGYCFEHNLLLTHALRALGYRAAGLAARVLWNRPADAPLPARGHMLVRVDLDEGPHVVDVGFGGPTPTGVLRLEVGIEQATPHEPFRLTSVDGEFLMEADLGGTWRALYRFDTTEQVQADYEVTSWYVCNHPESYFVTELIATRPAADRRYALHGRRLTVHHLDGGREQRTLACPGELIEVLETDFLLDLSGLTGLEAALSRLW
jgi:N-hydroxyarylamine O-acetyltransferase